MSVTQIATINVSINGKRTNVGDLGSDVSPFAKSLIIALATGFGASQSDRAFYDERTLAASGTEDLDLAGVLVDAFGNTITMATLKAVLIVAAAGNTNNVNITRPASNGVPLFLAAGDGIPVKPGGCFVWACPGTGITVTAATGDLITITNSGGTTGVTYDVILIGTSA
jgi:hypothetical protein